MHYPAGETEADKLRRERDLLTQRIAQRDDENLARHMATKHSNYAAEAAE